MGGEFKLFGEPLAPDTAYPDWYRPSRARRVANLRVLQGRHPFGMPLGPKESRCGTCVHLRRRGTGSRRVYLKCALSKITSGPATDARAKWRGCIKWEAAE